MRYLGIHYDTGTQFSPGTLTRPLLTADEIRTDLDAIRHTLQANAIRIVGENIDRLRAAAIAAADRGLTVFLNPWLVNGNELATLDHATAAAAVAEEVRLTGGDVVLVLGCEATLFSRGILPGATLQERVEWMLSRSSRPGDEAVLSAANDVLNQRLRGLVSAAGTIFAGSMTYAAGTWERVDWHLFDWVGIDHYRQGESAEEYATNLNRFGVDGKPLLVMEFGCCTFDGAQQLGGLGWRVLEQTGDAARWTQGHPPLRSEAVQAEHLSETLSILDRAGVDGAFVFTFVAPYLPHDPIDAERDYDRASYSLVKWLTKQESNAGWQPKASFHAVARWFAAQD